MSFLIFFNSHYNLFSYLFIQDLLTWLYFFNFLGVVSQFRLYYSKMMFSMLFNSNYSFFSEHLLPEAWPPYMTEQYFEFLVLGCFWCHFWDFQNFKNVILDIFNSNYSSFSELLWDYYFLIFTFWVLLSLWNYFKNYIIKIFRKQTI
jgi:hypothetical protein